MTPDSYQHIKRYNKIFFCGIGGISMSTLAMISKSQGKEVSGSDRAISPVIEKLRTAGIDVYIGHSESNIGDIDAVIYTAAIEGSNPELVYAREKGIPCITRGEYLGAVMSDYFVRIGVSGTHGKSTTTSMLAKIFESAFLHPTVACGARIEDYDGPFSIGEDEYFIYEACEYKDSFLHFCPTISVVLNIDYDHVDYFDSIETIISSFKKSIKNTEAVVVNFDDSNCRAAINGYEGWVISTGIDSLDADYRAENIVYYGNRTEFDFTHKGRTICKINLSVAGKHNVLNAIAAAAVANICGVEPEFIIEGLAGFRGAARRFEYKGNFKGASVYDDYAHHPIEIAATLDGARTAEKKKIWCVFQPHTYSRTEKFLSGFVSALSKADHVILTDIYAAREVNKSGILASDISSQIEGAVYIPDFDDIVSYLSEKVAEGDIIIVMGAGDVYKIREKLLNR